MAKFTQDLLNKIADVVTFSHRHYSTLTDGDIPNHVTITANTVAVINNGTTVRRTVTFTLDFPLDVDNISLKSDGQNQNSYLNSLENQFSAVGKLSGVLLFDPTETNFYNGNGYQNAFDGDINTVVDINPSDPNKALPIGLDLGAAKNLTKIRFAPANNKGGRLVTGFFEASNNADFSQSTTLYTITNAPSNDYTEVPVLGSFRYVRYVSPPSSSIALAELEFYGY